MPTPTPNGEAGAAGQVKHLKGPGSIVAAGELLARLEGMELSDDFGEDSVCNNLSLLCFQRDGRITVTDLEDALVELLMF